ncbi:uncharacterized protein BDZ83DRAFT_631972 [Colletotrichum acutatum]|uniref:Uncharacterized protein n=1 Tax=Glomerella acutata TaxID=27357 RepID=A0AAD8XFE3_GLOAC|nr:uncharacterized protein BDZ83DRAFT_631972 [Colletotrichum acutatum]KAK1719456.1 hypothetical protein BDZ83DRAFT_631972 [Colletotrichum acutatum]
MFAVRIAGAELPPEHDAFAPAYEPMISPRNHSRPRRLPCDIEVLACRDEPPAISKTAHARQANSFSVRCFVVRARVHSRPALVFFRQVKNRRCDWVHHTLRT